MVVRANVVLNRTVVCCWQWLTFWHSTFVHDFFIFDENFCYLTFWQSARRVKVSRITSVDSTRDGRLLLWTTQATTTKWTPLLTTNRPTKYSNRDSTPALQRKLNNKLLTLKKTDKIDFRRHNRLRWSVPQPPKLYGLPKLHQPNRL